MLLVLTTSDNFTALTFIERLQILLAFEKADVNVVFNAVSLAIEFSTTSETLEVE